MLEFVQALHAAFHTESKLLFVLYIGLASAVAFGAIGAALAYVVDTGYQRKLEEHPASGAPAQPPAPIIVRDTAEEERLRHEVNQLRAQLDEREQRKKNRQMVSVFLGKGTDIRNECDSLEERPYLEGKAIRWAEETEKGLRAIDASYAERFKSASGLSYGRNIGGQPSPRKNNDVWNWVNWRIDALNRIFETMPN